MNKTFKHVTNTKNGELVSGVAAETARTAGGLGAASVAVGTGPAQASAKAALWGLKAMAWAVLALCGSLSHAAAPVGVVAHGEASLVTQGSVLNVHQSSKAATINFQQLNLGKGEGVAVQARSASDITLLRVAGGMNVNGGFVTANNNLMISSPSGIAVSNGGKVSAQGEVYMTTQDMAVGQYTKPAARASAGAISVTGHSQISGSNIVLDAGSIHLSQATLTAAPVQKTDGITLQAATVSVQDSSLKALGGQINIGLDPQGTYAQSTTISASTLSAQAVQLAGIELKVDSTNTLTTETARLQTVDMKIDTDLAQLTSNVLATGSDVQLQGDNSVSMDRDVAIVVNSSHSNALRIANTGSQQNNPNAPSSPTAPKPNQVAILGTVNLNGGRKSLSVHSAGDLTLDGTRTDVSGDTTFQAVGTIVVNAAQLSTVGDLTIGRDAFGQGALSLHTVVFDSTLKGYNIETSGDTLTTQGVTARTTGGEWLLDPTNITISSAASTGGSLAAAQGQAGATTISTTDIQNAINAGTSVNVVGSGTITLSNNLSFANSTANATLTLDNTSGSKQGITLTGGIAATGTSRTSLIVKSAGGLIAANGVINVTGDVTIDNTYNVGGTTSGFINELNGQTYAMTAATQQAGVKISSSISANNITVKGALAASTMSGVWLASSLNATNDINLTGTNALNAGSGNSMGFYSNSATPITSMAGIVNITGKIRLNSLTTGISNNGIYFNNSAAGTSFTITANQINLAGSATNSAAETTATSYAIMSIGASYKINSTADYSATGSLGRTAISFIGDTTPGLGIGVALLTSARTYTTNTLSGSINQNASGGDIRFVSNNSISVALNAIAVAANNTGIASQILYDSTSAIAGTGRIRNFGVVNADNGGNAPVNFIQKSNGGSISDGTGAISTSGYIDINNNTVSGPSATVTTLNSVGASITGPMTAGTLAGNIGVRINAIATGTGVGIDGTSTITSLAGPVSLTANSSTGSAVSMTGAISSANGVDIEGKSTTPAIVVSVTNITNSNGDISVSADNVGSPGLMGIASNGRITQNANGGDITLQSNAGINVISSIISNGAAASDLNILAGGRIDINNPDNLPKTTAPTVDIMSNSGAMNVTLQSSYPGNTSPSIFGSNVYIWSDIVTRGGYLTIDGTGGAVASTTSNNVIAGETISKGSIANGPVYIEYGSIVNTNSSASTSLNSSSTGGNINVAATRSVGQTVGSNAGSFEQGPMAKIYSGNSINLDMEASGNTAFNFIVFGRASTADIYAVNDINVNALTSSSSINPANTGAVNITSPWTSYAGSININSVSTGNGVIALNNFSTLSGADGININTSNVGQTGINSLLYASPPAGAINGVFTSSSGVVSMTNTSTNTGSSLFSGIRLAGAVSGHDGVTIVNNSNSGSTEATSGIYSIAPISSAAGAVSLMSTTSTGTAISLTSASTVSAASGVEVIGTSSLASSLVDTYGAVSALGAITNSGAGGVLVQSTANTRTGSITDSGTGGIDITGGYNIAAGTLTGGTITGVGTLTNTGGGVISLSMATPTSATGGVIEDAAGVTNAVASVSSNVSYGNVGGVMGAIGAGTVNSVNYRSVVTGSTAINLEVETYVQEYGTAYNGTVANAWLNDSNNVKNIAISGLSSGFGIPSSTPSDADVLSSLRFAGNLGAAGNSNLVQSGTDLSVLGAITSSYGTVNVAPRAGKNTYTITPKALTITGSMASSVYDGVRTYAGVSAAGTTYAGLVTSIGGVATGDAVTGLTRSIASATAPTLSGVAQVGTFNDTLSNATGTGLSNYTISYVPGNFSITPASLTVTGGNKTSTYNATVQNNATYSVTGLLGTDTVSSVSGVASGTTVGIYNDSLSAAQGTGLANYNITYTNGALTIGKAALTITSAASSATYTGGAQTGTFTVSGLQGTVDAVTGISGAASGTNAGTYTSALGSATGTGLENYEITYANTGTFTINKANATLVGAVNTSVYNGNAQTNTGAVFTGLLGNDATTISATGYAQATHVAQGAVADNLGATGTNAGNYNFAVTNGSLRITPKALSVVGAQTTSVYNAATQTNTRTITGLVGGDAISVTGSASARNVSTTNDALSVAFTSGAASNYTTTITDGFLKITPAIISVSGILAADKAYDGTTSATLSGTPTISGVLGGDAVSINASSLTGVFDSKNAGTQNVSISGIGLTGADANNYQLSGGTTATTTATITPKTLSVSGTSLSTTYNAANQALDAPTVTGLVAGDNVIVSGNASGTNAGTYTATFAIAGTDSGNYALSANAPVLTIGKAALVVTADNNAKFVTQNDPSTLTAQVSGFQGSETASSLELTYTVARQAGETVAGGSGAGGAYTITPSGASSLTNYTVTYVPGLFTISPAGAVLIKMNPTTSTYGTVVGGTIASVQYVTSTGGSVLRTLTLKSGSTDTYTDGVGGEITITPTTTVTPTTGVGTYAGAISNTNNGTATSNGNFSAVETVVNTAVVNQASLTLTLNPVTKTYDASPFSAAGASATATGLMNGRTLADLGPIIYSGAAIGAINASATPYALLGSVGSGFANYNVTIAPSSLTITPAPLQITGGTNTYTFNNTQRTNTYAITRGQLFGSDSVTGLTGLATRLHAGTTPDTLTAATGVGLSNYSISFVNGGLTINPAQLYALATPTNAPVYNGSTVVPNTTVLSGVIGGTLVSGTTSLALSGANVGAQTIVNSGTVLSGPNAGDYVVVSSNLVNTSTNQVTPNIVSTGNGGGSVTITPAPLTITGGTTSHVFNNTQRTNTYSVTGQLYGNDSVTGVTGLGTGLRANTSANLVYADNLSGATGNGIANYAITYVNGGLTITRAPLTALATPNPTTYSGGTNVANTTVLSGIIAGTDVSGTTSLVLGSPNAGTQTITNNGTVLSGDHFSDYYVVSSNLVGTTPNQVTPNLVTTGNGGGSIVVAKAPLSLVGDTSSAVYNGTAQTNTVTITGAVNNETITASGSAQATNVSQGTVDDVLVAVAGSGVNLNNYAITITNGSLSITPATITLGGITANNKVYDGTDSATLNVGTVSFNGVLPVDNGNVTVNTSALTAQFDGESAQDGKTVYISGISIGGAAASNYQLSGGTTATATANITAAPLTITGATTSHVFNNTLRTNTYSVTGQLFGNDSVTGVMGLGTGLRANTSANLVYADNLSGATGNGIANYAITYVNGGLTITRAPLTALATPNATTYSGGTNVANTTVLSGIIAGTDVSGTTSLVLGSPNAGTQTIINNGTTLSGDFASDYYVVSSNLVGTTPNQVTPNLVTTGNGGGSIVVAKAPATVLAIASSATADGTMKTQGYTQTGVMAGDDLGVSGLASSMLAGEYASALSASNPNYAVVFVDAPFEILASKALELPQAPESVEPPHPVPFVWAPHPAPLEPLAPFCGLSLGLQEIQLAQAMASKAPAQVCGFDTSVLFDFGSAVLNAPAKEQLRQCQFDPSKPLLISGFVDAEGTRLANIGLGKRRALAVKDFMTSELRVPTQNIRMRLRDKTSDAAVPAAEWGQAASCRVHVSQVPDKR